jgi:NAD-dependent SIR2 family protein deacetylase
MYTKNETAEPYTIEQCSSCKEQTKRKFSKGDYVFKNISKCSSCKGQIRITKIFDDTLTQ